MSKRGRELPQGVDAYHRILSAIRNGSMRPGDRLTETDLAARFGISRTPVREAIRQLEGDGLVAHVPRAGATIRRLDQAEISELYDMRAVLEGTAARFAARAASDVEIEELAALHAQFCAAKDADARYEANRHFHAGLLAAARNRFLVKAVESIHTTLLILGPSTMEQADRADAARQEHADVLAALRDRNAGGAEMAMQAHINAAHRARLRQARGGA